MTKELEAFDPELAAKRRVVVANKVDAARDRLAAVRERVPDFLPISAVTGEGVEALLETLDDLVAKTRAEAPAAVGYVRHVVREEPVTVEREDSAWRVRGTRAERAVAITNMDNDEAVRRLQRKLIAIGVERALEQAGAKAGDEVRIGAESFDFEPEEGGHEAP